jgi:hypothetical protein
VVVEGKYLAYNQPAKTRGMVPKSAAIVVIMMGRKRSMQASNNCVIVSADHHRDRNRSAANVMKLRNIRPRW